MASGRASSISRESSRPTMAASGQAGGHLGGQVLQGVHGQVDAARELGVFELLGEEALALELGEGHVVDAVALGS